MEKERRLLGSWLGGPRSAGAETVGYPGGRLGLPETGPGAVAGPGRRLLSFVVDAALSDLVAHFLLPSVAYWNALVFFVEVFLFTALVGASAGQIVCRVRVLRLDRRPVGFLWAFVRTVLLCLIVPALIWDSDYRGLHDRASNSVVVRT